MNQSEQLMFMFVVVVNSLSLGMIAFSSWYERRKYPIMPAFSAEAKARKLRKKAKYYREELGLLRARVWLHEGCIEMFEQKAKELEANA